MISIQAVLTVIFLVVLVLSVVGVIGLIWPHVCIAYLAALAVVGSFPITRG